MAFTFDNYGKARFHLDRAERTQAKIEAMERLAGFQGSGQQQGRMSRRDAPEITPEYMAKTLLETFDYRRLCGIRDAHQRQATMYAQMHQAGIPDTPNGIGPDDGQIRIPLG